MLRTLLGELLPNPKVGSLQLGINRLIRVGQGGSRRGTSSTLGGYPIKKALLRLRGYTRWWVSAWNLEVLIKGRGLPPKL